VQVAQQQQVAQRPRQPPMQTRGPEPRPTPRGARPAMADGAEAPVPSGAEPQPSAETVAMMERLQARQRAQAQRQQTVESAGGAKLKTETLKREEPKVGRNDPCPCGSGKKYKKCHGAG
jgi:hypothetical protein